ncbi:MAG: hypothetical protein C7N36_14640 [Bacteroidetes bacterium]|nr:MAG: hypothetical protein C7N36_14640 [Bacteroidota bacterium]
MRFYYTLCLVVLGLSGLTAQDFQFIAEQQVQLPATAEVYFPLSTYRTLRVELAAVRQHLQAAPAESARELAKSTATIALPLPDGRTQAYRVVESSVLQPETQARWPQLRTYRLLNVDDSRYTGRLSVTPRGVTAVMNSAKGLIFIEPYAADALPYHLVYYGDDVVLDEVTQSQLTCGNAPDEQRELFSDNLASFSPVPLAGEEKTSLPSQIREYILALTCTGEYAQTQGGTIEGVLASFVTIVNVANASFEQEAGVRVTLIGNVEQLIFLNGATDPFAAYNSAPDLLPAVRGAITSQGFPTSAYDMGHVFTVGPCLDAMGDPTIGGQAALGSICQGNKDRALTCLQGSVTAVVRRVFVHEVGHQFNMQHTWANCPGSLDQLSSGSAFEPGSGSTIMSYSGSCGDQNVGGAVAPYYHGHSIDQFKSFTQEGAGSVCPTIIETNNTDPKVSTDYANGFYIPISTPFELVASAIDAENDNLTYCWEEMDLGPVSILGTPNGNAPIFRSYDPVSDPSRVFPRLSRIINNTTSVAEVLPTYSRNLTFACTVRDNNPEVGATGKATVAFKSTATAGPFLVLSPNDGSETWQVGDTREVRWDVANTTNELVNCQLVNIRLSADGGLTYPYLLAEGTPNSGSALVSVPNVVGGNMRIRVEANRNVFFDISNANFSIQPATAPTYTLDYGPIFQQVCLPNTVEVNFNTNAILAYEGTISLGISSELPAGVTASFSANDIQAGASSTLQLDLENLQGFDGPLAVVVAAATADLDTFFRTVYLNVVDNNFSDLALLTPAEGAMDILLSTDFSWTLLPNAETYDWELATDAGFSNVIDSRMGLGQTTFTSALQFAANSLFFWRVRPSNACGTGAWSAPQVFHTVNAVCSPLPSEDTPVNIPGTGPLPTRTSEIFVPFTGLISDINIPFLRVGYQPIQNFRITLISPAGTRVVLYNRNCFSTSEVTVGFDDDAPNSIVCPPDDGIVFRPFEPLSVLIGENSQGIWTLEVKVLETGFGAPGTIGEWNIEFCALGNAVGPEMMTNDTLFVPPSMANPVTADLLRAVDTEQGPGELVYSLVSTPAFGSLFVVDRELEPGSTFTQATINAGNLVYLNTDPAAVNDAFTFVVEDGTGGFLPIQRFNIKIDENAVVGTTEISPTTVFKLFPNPTTDRVRLQLAAPLGQSEPLRIFNVNGQVLLQTTLANGSWDFEWTTAAWPAGIYLVQIGNQTLRLVKQ